MQLLGTDPVILDRSISYIRIVCGLTIARLSPDSLLLS